MSRQLKKQHTKEKIIQTGIQVMSEQGIMATKTLDIAKAADLSHGSIFVHFPTKN
ncbi:MAG: TetR/AcrR family transcriptional regulator, partial [Caedimonadaceae bacterium]